MNPEIYIAETEEWKVIELSFYGSAKLSFGLWPAVLYSSASDKVVILEGERHTRRGFKDRYDMTFEGDSKDLRDIKFSKSIVQLHSKYVLFSECSYEFEDGHFSIALQEEDKGTIDFVNLDI